MSSTQPTRRTNSSPLRGFDYVRLGLFLVFFVGHAFMINTCQLLVCPWLKKLAPVLDRRFNQQAERWFCTVLLASTELWAPTKLVLTGDSDLLPNGITAGRSWFTATEGCMLISNHQTYFDWIIIWILSYMEKCDGFIKIILKGELKHVPIFGWGMQFLDFIFLKRKWAEDQLTLTEHMQRIVAHDDPAWLLIFPEGTVVCKNRIEISNAYAKKMGLRKPANTLLPRAHGSHFCLEQLRGNISYVYDLTVGYEGLKKGDIPEDEYGLVSMYGKGVYPREVHIHVKRYAVADIPTDDEGFAMWMNLVFVEKDLRMDKFYELGRFPHNHDEDDAIPADKPVLHDTKDAKAHNLLLEMAFMWVQFLSIITPSYFVLRYAASAASSVLFA